ncbi:MAG: NAD-dependent protein deacetylase [Rubrivivax sp.]|nr:MAG: NAD-dependent protein deacetylase [Rubrivivax sp.]
MPTRDHDVSPSAFLDPSTGLTQLAALLRQGPVVAITGAGLSTASGIPAYRDRHGQWQHPKPVQHQDFMRLEAVRRRYWARSYVGWLTMGHAAPNSGHLALAELERGGHIALVITQNVDGLHHKAGSQAVLDLHGRIDRVRCMGCGQAHDRALVQQWLADANQHVDLAPLLTVRAAPDGDAHVPESYYEAFHIPVCPSCGGLLKPDVVFFGDNVPRERVEQAVSAVADAAGLLVVGSSLMVYSGFRYADQAHRAGKPVIAINQGVTRADAMLTAKIELDCGQTLVRLSQALHAANPPA